MKNRHCLVHWSWLLRDLQTLGYGLHDRLGIRLHIAAEDCLVLRRRQRLSCIHGLCLTLRHRLNRALLGHLLSDINSLGSLTLHGLGLSLHRRNLPLGHSLCRTLICGSCYICGPGHALRHSLVPCKAGLILPLLSLALEGSMML